MKARLALFIAAYVLCCSLSSLADQDLRARFEKSLAEARHLTNYNYEIVWTDAYTNYDEPVLHATTERPFWRIVQYSYEASGARYRASWKLISGSQTNLIKLLESAFDGKERVDFDGDNRRMTVGNQVSNLNAADSIFNPMTVALGFVRKGSRDDPGPPLRFQDIPSIEPGNIKIPPEIILDANGDSFTPKTSMSKSITQGGTVESLMQFLNYTNLEGYRFPGKIVWTESFYSPTGAAKLRSAVVVTLISARVITDPIPDSVFRLDNESNSAILIWDAHKHGYIKTPPHTNAVALAAARPRIYDESADGLEQIARAMAIAKKEHKYILLQFGANWCVWCYRLDNLFESDKSISDELKTDYVVSLIDVNQGHNKDLVAKYGAEQYGLPFLVVLDSDGKHLVTKHSDDFEEGDHHNPQKVLAFLKEWASKR